MARHHLAVALIPPPALAAQVDTLRRLLGSSSLTRIPPHLTLVPPVNVRAEAYPAVLRTLDHAASAAIGFELRLGPVTSFAPRTPTVHLDAAGVSPADDDVLRSLRDRLLRGPLDRPEQFPFSPHVTLERRADPDRIPAVLSVLGSFEQHWSVNSVHLLEHRRPPERPPYWEPVHEVPLGPPVVVGRGGVELHLRTLGMLAPADAEVFGVEPIGPFPAPGGGRPVVVTASPPGAEAGPCGVAIGEVLGGRAARLHTVAVTVAHRHMGVGAQLLAAWCSEVASRGVSTVLADAGEWAGFLSRHGFVAVGAVMVRG